MIGKKKVIGICLTKIHDICRADYINRLHFLSEKADCKLMVFNSFVDFYNGNAFDDGAKSIYDIINYDIVDILVVLCNSFHNKDIVADIINNAKSCGKPIILIGDNAEGCWSICPDYRETYKEMLRHIIGEHGVKDTFFIGGMHSASDTDTITRLDCYKEILEENDITFDKERVGYGQYWEGPVTEIVYELVKDGKTHLRIDYKVSGLGSNSCGPALEEKYRLAEKEIKFAFAVKPV